MNQKVVIIGAGLGGLFTGAILAKEGLQVTVPVLQITVRGLSVFLMYTEELLLPDLTVQDSYPMYMQIITAYRFLTTLPVLLSAVRQYPWIIFSVEMLSVMTITTTDI